jgi:hypothetical protein
MSVSSLFKPNDFNLYSNTIISNQSVVTGDFNLDGNLNMNGGLVIFPPDRGILFGDTADRWYMTNNAFNDCVLTQQGAAVNKNLFLQTGNGEIIISNISISGSLRDNVSSPGNAGQILTSTGTALRWDNVYDTQISSIEYNGPWGFVQTGVVSYSKIGKQITITFGGVLTTSVSNTAITALGVIPLAFRPSYDNYNIIMVQDNTVNVQGLIIINTSGDITVNVGFSSPFANSGSAGFFNNSVSYSQF